MKQLLTIILLFPLFIACSSDDDDNTQDYTSFTVSNKSSIDLPNVVIGYLNDGKYKKISTLGDLKKGETSIEVNITDNNISTLYLFTDYNNVVKADITFTLQKNKKNNFELPSGISGTSVTDKTDPTQYPQ